MRRVLWFALMVCATACAKSPTGPDEAIPGAFYSPSGAFRVQNGTFPASQRHADVLDDFWARMQTCVGKTAVVHSVPVILMAAETGPLFGADRPGFVCPLPVGLGVVGGCSVVQGGLVIYALGDYLAHPSWSESMKHEMIHVLLQKATGDPDAGHTGPWWVGGLACQGR